MVIFNDAFCDSVLTSSDAVSTTLVEPSSRGLRPGCRWGQGATPTAPADRPLDQAGSTECGAHEHTVMILRPAEAAEPDERLAAADAACPTCGDTLAPWGYARRRSVRGQHGTLELRPRRVRCRGCRTTHVLFPAAYLPRRAVTVEIVGAALLATVNGVSHRTIAADLDLPADTVRGWFRRATGHASNLRQHATILAHRFDPELPPIRPAATLLGDALEALAAAAAATRRLGLLAPAWELISWFTSGRLLAPIARTG